MVEKYTEYFDTMSEATRRVNELTIAKNKIIAFGSFEDIKQSNIYYIVWEG